MKFLIDHMLGKLARWLRILGYDTIYYRGEDIHQMILLARNEDRVILTRNAKIIPKRPEDRIIRVTEENRFLQIKELFKKEYISLDEKKFFSRCLSCNALITEITREEAEGKVPDFILYQHKTFFRCPHCQRIYWPGSHQENMQKRLNELLLAENRERSA